MSPVEVEMSVAEVNEGDAGDEEDHPRVVTVALGVERIVTQLVTVGQVVHVVLFFPSVATCVGREGMRVAKGK